ncbi:LytTR family two component transcriptional regulator [Winogradskyella epiphytica]|uniref:LytTR family two component transcriptional regulator n=1 Tax=Winogradskyella epiphytica TaxID=262005 RepID=A0A2V4WTP5_9FLAO|nr:LytTR family DNA-binding domain-containing protein [Winogradskyella epiphytica]PYE80022.1 LytTR family two component transcriptional regulator [Winogradskyella epiphytica]GGW73212.1 DNA-binding response regulator [Winogradskyella epiphytica]
MIYRILIIEDEAPARKKLKRYISEVCPTSEIVAELDNVEDCKLFLKDAPELDLIFSDIELRDGNVFEVYDDISLNCPIIFATAYNDFLIHAFEANGIEYLLKPFSLDRFTKAWEKFIRLGGSGSKNSQQLMETISQLLKQSSPVPVGYKEQFAIKSATETYFIKTENIVYFQADKGVVFAFDDKNKRHIMPQSTLKEIEDFLDPQKFYKINRSEIVQKYFIIKIKRYNKNTVSIYLNSERIILRTSQNKTSDFNLWMGI